MKRVPRWADWAGSARVVVPVPRARLLDRPEGVGPGHRRALAFVHVNPLQEVRVAPLNQHPGGERRAIQHLRVDVAVAETVALAASLWHQVEHLAREPDTRLLLEVHL